MGCLKEIHLSLPPMKCFAITMDDRQHADASALKELVELRSVYSKSPADRVDFLNFSVSIFKTKRDDEIRFSSRDGLGSDILRRLGFWCEIGPFQWGLTQAGDQVWSTVRSSLFNLEIKARPNFQKKTETRSDDKTGISSGLDLPHRSSRDSLARNTTYLKLLMRSCWIGHIFISFRFGICNWFFWEFLRRMLDAYLTDNVI